MGGLDRQVRTEASALRRVGRDELSRRPRRHLTSRGLLLLVALVGCAPADTPNATTEIPKTSLANGIPRSVTEKLAESSPAAATSRPVVRASRAARSKRLPATGLLARIAQCESGGNPRAVSKSGKYRGLFQFDRATWASVGGSGDPAAASVAEQYLRASILLSRRGVQPWPYCGRRAMR